MKAAALFAFASLAGPLWCDAIHGRVVEDHSGAPLASVEVKIARTGVRELIADLETDVQGRFLGPELSPGEYRIDISKPNYAQASLRLHVAGSITAPLFIRLIRFGVISGEVSTPDGKPVADATVFVLTRTAGGVLARLLQDGVQPLTARVDEQGRYRLHDLPPGQYALAITYGASSVNVGSHGRASVTPGIGSGVSYYPNNAQPRWFTISGGERLEGVDFSVSPSALYKVTGNVELPAPKTRFWLALAPAEQPMLAAAVVPAEADGSFVFEGVPPGVYQLTAAGPTRGYGGVGAVLEPRPFFGRAGVSVVAQNVEGISLPVTQGRSISLTLRSTGGCPASAQATLTPLEDWAALLDRTIQLDSAREQSVTDLAPARYRVNLSKLGDECYQAGDVAIDAGTAHPSQALTLSIAPAGLIQGRLTNSPSPGDFVVTLVTPAASAGEQAVQVALPEPNGRFTFAGLRPGRYFIAAQRVAETSRSRWIPDLTRMFSIEVSAGSPTQIDLPAPVEGGKP